MYLMTERHQRTVNNQTFIEGEDFDYISIWECGFMKQCKQDTVQKIIVDSDYMPCPSQPRDACGDWQNRNVSAMQWTFTWNKNKVKMPVLKSYENKNGNIPLGHSERVTEISEKITVMRGIIKYHIFSPRRPWKGRNIARWKQHAENYGLGKNTENDDE